ncbi:MAG TPA: GNAT family N-acetyltransferase [Phycisphaerae bacterium]|nr:GNAT family N-acetyltransferase [Phycisphaerae bacterium]
MPSTPYWTNRLARPDETAAILGLVRAVHGDAHPELNERYFSWRYLSDTPFRADILMAEHEGRPIGIQPVAIFDWQWGATRLAGAMYTGVLTHPDHRRRGVFRSLIDSSNEHAAARGAQFSMTLPNDASLPGFLNFGDWQYPGLIPLALKVVDGAAMLRPKIGGLLAGLVGWAPNLAFRRRADEGGMGDIVCETAAVAPAELDEVFSAFSHGCDRLMIRRTAAYWNWRYLTRPGSSYRTLVARRAGRVVGAVITAVGRRMGLDVGLIADIVGEGGVTVLRRLIRAAEEELVGRGLGLVTCQATSPLLQEALAAEGYWRPEPRKLPKKFHFVYRPTGVAGLPKAPASIADWHLTFGDSDNM